MYSLSISFFRLDIERQSCLEDGLETYMREHPANRMSRMTLVKIINLVNPHFYPEVLRMCKILYEGMFLLFQFVIIFLVEFSFFPKSKPRIENDVLSLKILLVSFFFCCCFNNTVLSPQFRKHEILFLEWDTIRETEIVT